MLTGDGGFEDDYVVTHEESFEGPYNHDEQGSGDGKDEDLKLDDFYTNGDGELEGDDDYRSGSMAYENYQDDMYMAADDHFFDDEDGGDWTSYYDPETAFGGITGEGADA